MLNLFSILVRFTLIFFFLCMCVCPQYPVQDKATFHCCHEQSKLKLWFLCASGTLFCLACFAVVSLSYYNNRFSRKERLRGSCRLKTESKRVFNLVYKCRRRIRDRQLHPNVRLKEDTSNLKNVLHLNPRL